MEEAAACRACLSTDVKLLNMHEHRLKSAFESLTGISVNPTDGQPQYICIFCCALLTKCCAFKDRSLRAQQLLDYTAVNQHIITIDYINSLDRDTFKVALPYRKQNTEVYEITSVMVKLETFEDTSINSEVLKDESQSDVSDEEPLSKKVKIKPKITDYVKKYEVNEIKSENDSQDSNYFDDNVELAEGVGQTVRDLSNDGMDVLFLSKDEQLEEVLKRKESHNYLNSFYKCDKCYKGFITDVTYKNHMIRHDPSSGPEVCDVCQTRWPDVRSLRAHVSISHERRYTCKLCGHVAKSGHRAREHQRWHTGHTFPCKLCGASFDKSTSHLTHVRLQHPSEYCCEECGESFIGRHGLNMHKRKAHKGFERPSKYSCDECGKTFIRLHGLNMHRRKTHKVVEISKLDFFYKCSPCSAKFRNVDALNRHTSLLQNGICDSSLSPCTQCGDNFTSPELLKDHEKSHQKTDEVKCEECNRTFAHERSFASHYARVHALVKMRYPGPGPRRKAPVVCEICGRKCVSNANLVYHQRTHTGEKPFACSECPKRFSVYQRLKIHTRTHTGESPFKCLHCPKAFKHKAALNRHDRVHTGLKPYVCAHCDKSFSQSNSMKLHVRTVHLKQPAPYRSRRVKPDQ